MVSTETMSATVPVQALRLEGGKTSASTELLIEESAVALVYNGISHAVMMATPQDLEDFALGFSLSEGIIGQPEELRELDIARVDKGLEIRMQISEERFWQLKERRRTLSGRSGCGLCGTESLEHALRPAPRVSSTLAVAASAIREGMAHMSAGQQLNRDTGAVHAAALISAEHATVREDVGRHNALDKLVGAIAREPRDGFAVITSRASYEMVHKAACANIPLLAAISAPTALAVRLAEEAGITLIGFTRDQRMTVFSHPGRVLAV